MKQAVLYTRVSTLEQAREGISLDAQMDSLDQWSRVHGYEVLGQYSDEGLSGKRADNRPQLQDALTQACDTGAALAVYSLSRLARSTKDAIQIADRLNKANADLVSLSEQLDTTTASGKMLFRMLAVFAEFERDLISERTKTALALKRQRGEKLGGRVPFGYAVSNGKLVPVANQQEAIALGLQWAEEGMSFRGIGREWQASGFTEHLMTNKTVAGILRRHGWGK